MNVADNADVGLSKGIHLPAKQYFAGDLRQTQRIQKVTSRADTESARNSASTTPFVALGFDYSFLGS